MSRKTRPSASGHGITARTVASRPAWTVGIHGLLGAFTFNAPSMAADTGPAPQSTNNDNDQLQEVVVTGIRASLQKALDIKEQAVGVVDAISAEDIGAFPDASLGEAMQRVPGVTVTRTAVTTTNKTNGAELFTGNPSSITVRGFGGDFTETLVDGRPQASAVGRTFDFASVGADWVTEVGVYKTPDFTLSSGAVGATVNIKFPKPFDHPGPQARAFASETTTTNDGSFRPATGVLFSDTFFDNTLGILVNGDFSDQRVESHHFDIVGWKGANLNSCQMAGGPACVNSAGQIIPNNSLVLATSPDTTPANPTDSHASWYPQALGLYNDRTDDRRKDGRVVIQWHPTDAVMVTLDDNYSDDRVTSQRAEYSTWFNSSEMYNVHQDGNGTITNFTYGPAPTDFDADVDGTYIQNNTFGLNVKWEVSDQWTTELDADQSASHLNPHGEVSNFDVDVGYGPSYNGGSANYAANAAAGFPNSYIGGLTLGGNNSLPYPSQFGPNNNGANVAGLNPLIVGSHVLPIQSEYASDYINQAKLSADWHSGGTRVNFGVQFVQDTRNGYTRDSFTNNAWQLWSGYGSPSGNTSGVALPLSALGNPSVLNTSGFFSGFNNSGQLPSILQFNPYSVYNYLQSLGVNGANPNTITPVPPACTAGTLGCFAPYTGGAAPLGLNPTSIVLVREKTYSPYVSWQQKFKLSDKLLTVNLGLRYDRSDVTTGGFAQLPTTLVVSAADHTNFVINKTLPVPIVSDNSYHYVLPSVDVNFFPLDSLKVRFDASRTLTRPPLNEITPTLTLNGRVGALTATGNNPDLLPYLSNNFDLGAEWYYGQNEYLAVDTFFKHVSQFPEQQTINVAINGVQDPTTGQTAQWAETTFVNSPSANVYGAEIGWQQMLALGFGYQINGTVVHTNEPYNRYDLQNQFYLPGLANSANFVGFYQNHGFQARVAVNWTAEQLVSTVQEQSGGAFGNEPIFTRPYTEVDFSTSYDFNDHLSVFFKALNLTDSEIVEHGRFNNQILNVQDIGRVFTMGIRAKL
jgi:iron complex outermembrane recepter protein